METVGAKWSKVCGVDDVVSLSVMWRMIGVEEERRCGVILHIRR